MLGSPPTEFQQAYLIQPPRTAAESLSWQLRQLDVRQAHRTLRRDRLLDTLPPTAVNATGYYGSEHLGQLDANNYRAVGMLLLKDKLVYSWQMLHKRGLAKTS